MNLEERKAYARHRIKSAFETFDAAKLLAENEYWNSAMNRLYYAVFYSVNALLILNEIDTKSHSTTKSMFSSHFVKTGIIDKKFGKLFSKLHDWRQKGDYDNLFELEPDHLKQLFKPAEDIIKVIAKMIEEETD
ncbi:MAG: HEPN domain-containing protein [Bacteroidales bacterium]|nr:HEPN domain-containing protein [Bacteroidales bacterium]MCF8344798.1 HEPN domain-containing protein [Bacteroidales bacterium]MCF8351780.1 HEPN domain-containing protein [Bacteroidales bacterium]MCF8375581.1 HEPN domain-containing protein [Bacteroidales bacterium]